MEKPTSATQSGSVFGVKKRGTASKMLESRGFGWLLDEEDLDEEDQKPLLYVFVLLFYRCCMCTFEYTFELLHSEFGYPSFRAGKK